MALPKVVIIGRPNVGKSSIFNWLAGRRLAIVDDVAGVTRDRMTHLIRHNEVFFEIVDTGGIGINDVDDLSDEIEDQIQLAMDSADVILFVVDTRSGMLALDREVAKRLRYIDKPIICVANKTDEPEMDPEADEFYSLGRGKLIRVSALQNRNRDLLLDMVSERVPHLTEEELMDENIEPSEMKVALVGRRNVGKSTFINSLTQAERMIVSEVAGTTRDSVDVHFELDGKSFIAIDTAGIRKRKSVRTDVEFYSTHRAQRSIRRADVTLMFFDCSQRISQVDKQLCKYIADNYKACVFVVNKWDLMVEHMPTERWVTYLRDTFQTMSHVPIAFITGQTGKNMKALLNHAQMLFKQTRQRVSTSYLNRLIRGAVERHPPPVFKNRRPKIYYCTQVSTEPPTIVIKCNNPKAFAPDYRRYLLSVLRDQVEFGEVPIKMYLQRREQSDERDEMGKIG
ncbi:MAG: ribosome biogenesis GTPase Der [Planctomycetaceae bacterium]|jgi:GTPase|nr:ribosome biogenesis GTPase Der [Planctomycetaceae bacterium]MBT4725937.1 ribosome biogenesis GTPase Der [Planctomycetaceae bacterium]MBT4847229.1 ribosome biogenesis GTPase Der [Planctomycetaceae bacterium]MBT5124238.1 ribosome biogenesis GTPase Der [Planctomycetaceae bacterium]MBT5599911.1 ribosome biogenesis GTPase Der [Planctomycetaceae bacterium]